MMSLLTRSILICLSLFLLTGVVQASNIVLQHEIRCWEKGVEGEMCLFVTEQGTRYADLIENALAGSGWSRNRRLPSGKLYIARLHPGEIFALVARGGRVEGFTTDAIPGHMMVKAKYQAMRIQNGVYDED